MKLFENESRFASDMGRFYAQSLQLPQLQPHNVGRDYGFNLAGGLTEGVDIKAPGVRENWQQGNIPSTGVDHRSNLFDVQHTVNNAPMVDFSDKRNNWLLNDSWSRRVGAEWFRIIQETQNVYHPAFQERGQWNLPPHGRIAIRDLLPSHTTPWI